MNSRNAFEQRAQNDCHRKILSRIHLEKAANYKIISMILALRKRIKRMSLERSKYSRTGWTLVVLRKNMLNIDL